jgi:hypothetical protein
MKALLVTVLFLCLGNPAYSQVKPDFTSLEGSISADAAKFCDVYSLNKKAISNFMIGSAIVDKYKSQGVQEVKFICLDGFEKTFWMTPKIKREVATIDYLSPTKGLIHYSDGSESTSELFRCSARPIAFLVIKKVQKETPKTP